MIPSFKPGIMSSNRIRAAGGGGGGDVTPNAVNWADVEFPFGGSPAQTSMLQITGISSTITLRVTYTSEVYAYGQQYSVQSTASFGTGTAIASNGTFTVSNGQYVGFSSSASGGGGYLSSTNWTVTNDSDGGALIDTFKTSPSFGVAEE